MTSASELTVARFVPAHFAALELQDSQRYVRDHMPIERLIRLANGGPAYTGFVDGRVICCGGLREYDENRGVLWSFIGRDAGPHFVQLHRYVARFIETVDRAHIQATCRTGFAAGARWLELLGFTWSRSLGPYGPACVPHDLFERVH